MTAGPQSLVVDVSIKDVVPTGATAPYASPEVLHSLKLQFQGAQNDEEGIMINGCLADMWACGCILYQMLTGAKPFLPKETDASTRQAPAGVPASLQKQWRMYDAVAEAQREWVGSTPPSHAFNLLPTKGVAVSCHPAQHSGLVYST